MPWCLELLESGLALQIVVHVSDKFRGFNKESISCLIALRGFMIHNRLKTFYESHTDVVADFVSQISLVPA
jgi:hypothetical protein